jgi:hypothetical protein
MELDLRRAAAEDGCVCAQKGSGKARLGRHCCEIMRQQRSIEY